MDVIIEAGNRWAVPVQDASSVGEAEVFADNTSTTSLDNSMECGLTNVGTLEDTASGLTARTYPQIHHTLYLEYVVSEVLGKARPSTIARSVTMSATNRH